MLVNFARVLCAKQGKEISLSMFYLLHACSSWSLALVFLIQHLTVKNYKKLPTGFNFLLLLQATTPYKQLPHASFILHYYLWHPSSENYITIFNDGWKLTLLSLVNFKLKHYYRVSYTLQSSKAKCTFFCFFGVRGKVFSASQFTTTLHISAGEN